MLGPGHWESKIMLNDNEVQGDYQQDQDYEEPSGAHWHDDSNECSKQQHYRIKLHREAWIDVGDGIRSPAEVKNVARPIP